MLCDDKIYTVHDTFAFHALRSAQVFLIGGLFARLEKETHAAAQLFPGEQLGRAQCHRRVRIVSAGVHFSSVLRNIFRFVLFQYGQRIHIRADGDQLAAFSQLCDDTGLSHPALDTVPHLFEFICDDLRGALDVEARLRMHVKITPPFDQLLRNCMCLLQHKFLRF